jgi:very-short-patch-repair endonuclease
LAGTKWRRQQKMGRFVDDFFCAEHGLVIEIDGAAHRDRQDLDAERQRILEQSGVRVVRFSASDVENHLPVVLDRLTALLSGASPLIDCRDPSR